MRVLVLGAGATGAYFGARLIEGGHDVVFLVRPARAELLRHDGLRMRSARGDFSRAVDVAVSVPARTAFDLVVLSCKAYDLDAALAAIAPAVGAQTRVLPLLNGLRHLDMLDLAFGTARVWGGLCHISVALQSDGSVLHLGQLARLTFGARQADERLAELAPLLLDSPLDARHSERVVGAMWEKFAFLSTLAAMTCLMRASVGEIVATPDGGDLMRRCYRECVDVAERNGQPVSAAAYEEAQSILTAAESPLKASMLRDLLRGATTEGEHILGDMRARAAAAAVDVPLISAACSHVRAFENARTR